MIKRMMTVLSFIKLSRKYTFALLGIIAAIGVLCVVHKLGFSDSLSKCAIISCELVILVITTTYLTGQAKIDIQAVYGNKGFAPENPNPFKNMLDKIGQKETL